jgi:hypothetical protein
MGSAASGIEGHIRGWNVGVRVEFRVDGEGRDVADIYRTGGSNGSSHGELIATVAEDKE